MVVSLEVLYTMLASVEEGIKHGVVSDEVSHNEEQEVHSYTYCGRPKGQVPMFSRGRAKRGLPELLGCVDPDPIERYQADFQENSLGLGDVREFV
jgi:hypothetical protein